MKSQENRAGLMLAHFRISEPELNKLRKIAKSESRSTPQQAKFFIEEALKRYESQESESA